MKKIDIGIIFGTTILLPALICGVDYKISIRDMGNIVGFHSDGVIYNISNRK